MEYLNKFLSFDKLLHFLVGYCVAASLYFVPFVAIGAAVGAGVLKEVLDYVINKYFDGKHGVEFLDFITTALGGLAGVAIPFALKHGLSSISMLI